LARKILLADDSVTAQNMGRKILADAGYEVITVNNGSAALKKIAEQKPDLIILDVYMPGYSGLEVCQRLKEAAETSRTPVLLTVGKLEPFKPEEAKRVRAEGFIVKPFEASELLSVLSKLEDKIVHRPEPSKPGRFARAIAAADQADRPEGTSANKETGWKNRIAFPSKKSKAAEKEDDSETDNAVKPDLREVIERREKQSRKEETSKPAEDRLQVAAIASADLPKDVTTEELAALAAAASQIQAKFAAVDSETAHLEADKPATTDGVAQTEETLAAVEEAKPSRGSEANWDAPSPGFPEANAAESESHRESTGATFAGGSNEEVADSPAPAGDEYRKDPVPAVAGSDAEVIAAIAALEPANGKAWDAASPTHEIEKAVEHHSPVAASEASTAATGPRWTAVPVATNADESTVSLEHEMHKAYAAFAAADGGHAGLISSTPAGQSTATPDSREEIETPQTAAAESALPSGAERITSAAEMPSTTPAEIPQPLNENAHEATGQAVSEMPQAVESEPATQIAETSPAEEAAEAAQPEAKHAARVAEHTSATSVFEAASVPELASAVAEVTAGWNNSDDSSTQETARKQDSELAATTAAAWASWRQIRETADSGNGDNSKQAKDFKVENPPAVERDSAAMAAAAGAEKSPEESSTADSTTEAMNIASLVDSLMAELRPKIVAEISKKLASEKK
jgi:CheY-like chemotaxis protein